MPNWVTVRLIYKTKYMAKFIFDELQWHNKRFSFKALVPHPKTVKECPDRYILLFRDATAYAPSEKKPWFNWYKFHIEEWGCKWDCCDAFLDDNMIVFKTPWDPPCNKLMQKLANQTGFGFTLKAWDETEDESKEPEMFEVRKFIEERE